MAQHSLYTIRPSYWRCISPIILQLSLFGVLLYVAVVGGMPLLGYPLSFTVQAILGVGILCGVGILLFVADRRVRRISYHFFQNAIRIAHLPVASAPHTYRKLNYLRIRQIDVRRTLLDRVFGTATFRLSPTFELVGIRKPRKLYDYIQRMMTFNQQYPEHSSRFESS